MFDNEDINLRLVEVTRLFASHLGIRAATLESGLKKAGRRLPPEIRRAGQSVIDAQALSQHPRLSRQIDVTATLRALDDIADHLSALDPKAQRVDAVLHLLAGLAFKLLVILAAVAVFLKWREYI